MDLAKALGFAVQCAYVYVCRSDLRNIPWIVSRNISGWKSKVRLGRNTPFWEKSLAFQDASS